MLRIKIFLICIFFAVPVFATARFKSGTLPLVDGVYNSTQVVVSNRQPIFSWQYNSQISSFTIIVSSDDIFSPSGEIWNYTGSTNSINSINNITRISYNLDGNALEPLEPFRTYYWQVTIFDAGTSASADGQFSTVPSAITFEEEKLNLEIDLNNPFNPNKGQYTIFRFGTKDRERSVQLRIFTISGEFVKEWPEQTILKDAMYTQIWDGKNEAGEIVARGIYLVNLIDVGEKKGVTRRVAVIKN